MDPENLSNEQLKHEFYETLNAYHKDSAACEYLNALTAEMIMRGFMGQG
jgi:hypothetical protein